ncbi:hypothetical protein IE53DRAFT_104205 [Violaceomyces palustris]|uniref:Uncharacterized protein n=1 Tax=Violaceomyces palustris TaxID=1673888 RepID=A0ACD0P759_9BASI|nr:hypothetical protein IE53DRAFT_104205 [Violaceomyces palustris]
MAEKEGDGREARVKGKEERKAASERTFFTLFFAFFSHFFSSHLPFATNFQQATTDGRKLHRSLPETARDFPPSSTTAKRGGGGQLCGQPSGGNLSNLERRLVKPSGNLLNSCGNLLDRPYESPHLSRP